MGKPSAKRKREAFKKLHPEGRKSYSRAKRKLKLEKSKVVIVNQTT